MTYPNNNRSDNTHYPNTQTEIPPRHRVLMILSRTEGGLVATVEELAADAGISYTEALNYLSPYLEDGSLHLENVGDHSFIHPHGAGVVAPGQLTVFPPNLWAHLRTRLGEQAAYAVWMLIRDMERVGWFVEARPAHAMQGLGALARPPLFGVYVRNLVVPVIVFPDPEYLVDSEGLLSMYEAADASSVAVVAREGALDETVTAVRAWALAKSYLPEMMVLVLEEPRYDPVVVRCDDGSVTPHAVSAMARTSDF